MLYLKKKNFNVLISRCGRQNNGPPKCPCPNPKTCEYFPLHGKRDLADVIKLIDGYGLKLVPKKIC